MADTRLNIDIRGKDNASRAINKVDNNLAKLGRTIKIAGGLLGGFFAVKAAKQFIELGGSVSDVTSQFEALSRSMGTMSSKSLSQLRSSTRGLVSDLDLMSSSNSILNSRIGNTIDTQEELNLVFQAADRISTSTHRSLEEVLKELSGSPKAMAKYIGAFKEGGDVTKQLNDYLSKTAKPSNSAADNIKKISVVITNLKNNLAKGIADSPAFQNITKRLSEWFDTGKIQKWIDTLLRGLEKVFNLIDRNPKAALAITAASAVALSPGGQGAGKAAGEILTKRAAAELGIYGGASAVGTVAGAKAGSRWFGSFKKLPKTYELFPNFKGPATAEQLAELAKFRGDTSGLDRIVNVVRSTAPKGFQRASANTARFLGSGIEKLGGLEQKSGAAAKLGKLLNTANPLMKVGRFMEFFGKFFAILGKLFWPLTIIEGAFGIFKGASASFAEKGTSFGKVLSSIAKSINKMFDGDTAFGKVGKVIFKIINWAFEIGKVLGDKLADLLSWLNEQLAKLSGRDLKREAEVEKNQQALINEEKTRMEMEASLRAKAEADAERKKRQKEAAKAADDAANEAYNKRIRDLADSYEQRKEGISVLQGRTNDMRSKWADKTRSAFTFGEELPEVPLTDEAEVVTADFSLLADATNVLIDTLNQEVITLKYFGSALGKSMSGSGQSLFGSATQSWLTTKITGTPAQIGVGLALMAGGKILSSIFGKKKNEQKDSRNLEKIAINTGDTANYLKQVIGAPTSFANGGVSALAYAGISRSFNDSYARG